MRDDDLDFIYRLCHAARYPLDYWLSLPEFRRAIRDLKSKQVSISEENVLDIMTELYEERVKYSWQYPWFKPWIARKAINRIRRHLSEKDSDSNPNGGGAQQEVISSDLNEEGDT